MGQVKEVFIKLSSNPKIFQVIDIMVVGILEAYGILLSRDWLSNLNGYIATDWSHFLFSSKGNPKYIRINSEKH